MKLFRKRKQDVPAKVDPDVGWRNLGRPNEVSFTAEQLKLLNDNKCPWCQASAWMEGPSGGASLNMYCGECKGGINLLVGMNLVEIIKIPEGWG